MLLTPKDELQWRIKQLQQRIMDKGIEAVLLHQNVDLFYFSGTAQNGYLYIPGQGEPILLIKRSLARARAESSLERVEALGSIKQLAHTLQEFGYALPQSLGLELDILPAKNYLFIQQLLPGVNLLDVSTTIKQIRQVKSDWELAIMRRAGQMLVKVYGEIPALIRAGMTELELAGQVEAIARKYGHIGMLRMRAFNQEVFYGHLMSGSAAAVPSFFDGPTGGQGCTPAYPQSAGNRAINRHEPILVDYSGILDGYIVDKTRIFALGNVDEQLVRAHQVALEIQSKVVELARPGAIGQDLYQLALKIVEANGLSDHFMGIAPDQAKFVGHGVGLELDELPIMATGMQEPLGKNMVFALEPKFVFPDIGVVGIENTFVILDQTTECLTPGPEDIIVV